MEKCAVPVEGGEVVQFPTPVTLKLIDTVLVGLGGLPRVRFRGCQTNHGVEWKNLIPVLQQCCALAIPATYYSVETRFQVDAMCPWCGP